MENLKLNTLELNSNLLGVNLMNDHRIEPDFVTEVTEETAVNTPESAYNDGQLLAYKVASVLKVLTLVLSPIAALVAYLVTGNEQAAFFVGVPTAMALGFLAVLIGLASGVEESNEDNAALIRRIDYDSPSGDWAKSPLWYTIRR